jgi:hypothetical protein
MRRLSILGLGGLLLLGGSIAAASADELTLTAPDEAAPRAASGGGLTLTAPAAGDGGSGDLVLPGGDQDGSDAAQTGLVLPSTPAQPARPAAPQAPAAVAAPRQQADGSTLISPLWLVADMLRNGDAAKKRYQGKVLELTAPLDRQTDYGGDQLHLYFSIDVPGYGERDIDCRVDDAVSRETAAHLGKGAAVAVAGIYERNLFKGETHDAMNDQLHVLSHAAAMDEYSNTGPSGVSGAIGSALETLRLDECLVLTGHPDPEDARILLVAAARAGQE